MIEDAAEGEDELSSSVRTSGSGERLRRIDDSNWEMGVPMRDAGAGGRGQQPRRQISRRKSTRSRRKMCAKLSGSFRSTNSEEGSVH